MISDGLKVFLVSFLVGALWYRVFLRLAPKSYVFTPTLRSLLRLQWHHYHHGVIIVLGGVVSLIFLGVTPWILAVLGVGMGLIMDEFIWSLKMPGNRDLELNVYNRSFRPTLFLLAILVLLILFMSYLTDYS